MKARIAAISLFLVVLYSYAQGHNYQTSFQNARVLLNEKLYDQALVQAKWAIASDDSQWGGYYVAGTALVGLQRQGEAVTFFQAALVRAPEQAKPIINSAIASCLQISANESQAKPAITYSPPSAPQNDRLAESYFRQGMACIPQTVVDRTGKMIPPPGCVEAFQGYLAVAPNGVHAQSVRGILQGLGEPPQTAQAPPSATDAPPPSARVPLGALDLTVPYASAQQPTPARPQFDQGQTTTVGNCYEEHAGFGFRAKPGTFTLGPNFEWQEPTNTSHNFSVSPEQVGKFQPYLWRHPKQEKTDLEQQKRIDVRDYAEELAASGDVSTGVGIGFSVNGKSKVFFCGRVEFTEIFRYFQTHGFYQDVTIIQ